MSTQPVKPNSASNNQRRLYFSILRDIRNTKKDLIINLAGKIVPLPAYTLSTEELKELLKIMDLDLPRQKNGKPVSFAAGQIDTPTFTEHIRRLELWCIESHIPLQYYEAEMSRLENFSQYETKLS